MLLGVNIDHIAVLREARRINDPNPLDALGICKISGANQITIHLREDRRHINDTDAKDIVRLSQIPVNLECSINDDIVEIVSKLKPHRVTLVPENRQEVTTEGGLDLVSNFRQIEKTIKKLHKNEIEVSLFVDPTKQMIKLSKDLNVQWVELHTGTFANIFAMFYSGLNQTSHSIQDLKLSRKELNKRLKKSIKDIKRCSHLATSFKLKVAAGHGLNYHNVKYIKDIKEITELNIGQSIIARSIFSGLYNAITQMKKLLK